jgi:hypothetical protein
MPVEPIIADGFSPLVASRHIIVAFSAGAASAMMQNGTTSKPLHIASMARTIFISKGSFGSAVMRLGNVRSRSGAVAAQARNERYHSGPADKE